MKYLYIFAACMLLDVIEPIGCSRDMADADSPAAVQDEAPALAPAE